jgi:hypothetical protein
MILILKKPMKMEFQLNQIENKRRSKKRLHSNKWENILLKNGSIKLPLRILLFMGYHGLSF